MRRRASIVLGALVLGTAPSLAGASSVASASPLDVASTHAYIRANYELARASVALIKPAQARIKALARRLGRECPQVGAGSPEDEASQPMSYEAAVALWSVSYGAAARPIRSFSNAVKRLRWSSPKLARIARRYARDLHELATLRLPDLCADVQAWKATGFQTVPTNVLTLTRRVEAIEPEPVPDGLLARYERSADRRIVARTERLEEKLLNAETVLGYDDWETVLFTLGLNL
jgi:hypothetical protein